MDRKLALPAAVLLVCFAYAAVRYTVFGSVSAEQLPSYVLNKAASLAGLALIALSRFVRGREARRSLGLAGASLIGLHTALSLMLLHPAYFPRFFHASGMMTWQVELSMLAGAAGLCLLALMLWKTLEPARGAPEGPGGLVPFLGRGILAATAAHALFMGYPVWLEVKGWPGGLPPITLISFLLAAIALVTPSRR